VAQSVGRVIALLFHNLGARRGVSGQQHAPAVLYPRERPGTHFTVGYHHVNRSKLYVIPAECIYVLSMFFERKKTVIISLHRIKLMFYNREGACLLSGMN
jgi:hypothetical protein